MTTTPNHGPYTPVNTTPNHGPYTPFAANTEWTGVANRYGYNCLAFEDKPGAKFTTRTNAEMIAAEWNEKENAK